MTDLVMGDDAESAKGCSAAANVIRAFPAFRKYATARSGDIGCNGDAI
jgi:hypothetical protein